MADKSIGNRYKYDFYSGLIFNIKTTLEMLKKLQKNYFKKKLFSPPFLPEQAGFTHQLIDSKSQFLSHFSRFLTQNHPFLSILSQF
ncbi:MAG: hypothetical protein CVU41_15570 [Chloroflexi bacterium HGW-Chloroflexi-3]|nr:MAG: hypothetical protein CVU41_15570 [Chloroflexi bacterium HGW-Chloroflexi-3]